MPKSKPRKQGPGRTCAVCRRTPVTLEHVWPQWLAAVPEIAAAQPPRGEDVPHIIFRTSQTFDGDVVVDPEYRGKRILPPKIQVKVVCEKCNGGWMSALEVAVAPILLAMIRTGSLPSDIASRTVLAAWATKTAAMFQHNDPKTRVHNGSDLRHLRDYNQPPPGTTVWVLKTESGVNWDVGLSHSGATIIKSEELTPFTTPGATRANVGSSYISILGWVLAVHHSIAYSKDWMTPAEYRTDKAVELWPDTDLTRARPTFTTPEQMQNNLHSIGGIQGNSP